MSSLQKGKEVCASGILLSEKAFTGAVDVALEMYYYKAEPR